MAQAAFAEFRLLRDGMRRRFIGPITVNIFGASGGFGGKRNPEPLSAVRQLAATHKLGLD